MPETGTCREFSACGRVQFAPASRDETKRTSSVDLPST